MRVEIVVIGNELLDGGLADTNTARLGRLLRGHGLRIRQGQTVPDEPEVIVDALRLAGSRADLVLVTGGLGPTEDDLTIAAAAAFAGAPMVEDAPTLDASSGAACPSRRTTPSKPAPRRAPPSSTTRSAPPPA